VNIARLVAPLDDPALAGFVAALDPVNAAADRAPGFIWRLQTEEGNATSVEAFTWDAGSSAGVIVNMSVWTDVEHLGNFVYGELHRQVLRRRRQWFQFMREAWMACWWVPSGYRPSTGEAEARILYLRQHGPSAFAFTLKQHYPPPGSDRTEERAGNDGWLRPARAALARTEALDST
jgi:hypothetical protein